MKHLLIKLFSVAIIFGFTNKLQAQDKADSDSTSLWKRSGSAGLTFANVGLENWAGGGVSSVSVGFVGNYKATRESDKTVWSNQLLRRVT